MSSAMGKAWSTPKLTSVKLTTAKTVFIVISDGMNFFSPFSFSLDRLSRKKSV